MVNIAQELVMEMIQRSDDIERQIDTLSTGRLTPGIISYTELRDILLDINNKLPTDLDLLINPSTQLWDYYRTITCTTTMFDNKIMIILHIPLINQVDQLEIFEVINLPLPNLHTKIISDTLKQKKMTAMYDIESEIIAIDKARTKYSLLTKDQSKHCMSNKFDVCKVITPLYPANINKFCVMALFLSNREIIKSHCNIIIKMNGILPVAKYIHKGIWAVALQETLSFAINCKYNMSSTTQIKIIHPPIDTISLPEGCIAYSSELILPSYQEFSSSVDITFPPLVNFDFKQINFSIWQPVYEVDTPTNWTWNLTDLGDVEEINMDSFLKELNEIKRVHVEVKSFWNTTNITIVIIILSLVVLLGIYVGRKYCSTTNVLGLPSFKRNTKDKCDTATDSVENRLETMGDVASTVSDGLHTIVSTNIPRTVQSQSLKSNAVKTNFEKPQNKSFFNIYPNN